MNDKENQIEICENCKIKDTCSNRILVHMENCKVNDCDYYCEATDREKQIEEMARDIEKYVVRDWSKVLYIGSAKALYNAGYRHCKDKMVLSREEYQNDFNSQFNKGYEKGSQETAREIISKAKDLCKELENQYSHLCKSKKECLMETCRYEGVLAVKRVIYEIAKAYGVEVEE